MLVRQPFYVVWETTLLCNAKCVHCYSGAGPNVKDASSPSTDEALDIIDQLAAAGIIVLGFSGGEPLLRNDWDVLAEHAIGKGLRVTIGTNGRAVKPKIAARIRELGVHNVTVSIDSCDPALHDKIRASSGLFDDAIRGVRALTNEGVKVTIGYTPTKHNFHEARDIVELAKDLGASTVNLSEFLPVGRGTVDLALTNTQLRTLLEQWLDMAEEHQDDIRLTWHDCRVALFTDKALDFEYKGCSAGIATCRITHNLDVTPCVALDLPVGNLREGSFKEIWGTSETLIKLRDRSNIQVGNCSDCEHKITCGGCRSVSLATTGDLFGGDTYCWVKPEGPLADQSVSGFSSCGKTTRC